MSGNISTKILLTAMEKLEEQIEKSSRWVNTLKNLASGSPLAANLASDMTDTSKTYVYCGSEAGYSNGYIYYYNNAESKWVKGWLYQAVDIADNGVDVSKTTFLQYSNSGDIFKNATIKEGYRLNSAGNPFASANYSCTASKLNLTSGVTYKAEGFFYQIAFFDENGTLTKLLKNQTDYTWTQEKTGAINLSWVSNTDTTNYRDSSDIHIYNANLVKFKKAFEESSLDFRILTDGLYESKLSTAVQNTLYKSRIEIYGPAITGWSLDNNVLTVNKLPRTYVFQGTQSYTPRKIATIDSSFILNSGECIYIDLEDGRPDDGTYAIHYSKDNVTDFTTKFNKNTFATDKKIILLSNYNGYINGALKDNLVKNITNTTIINNNNNNCKMYLQWDNDNANLYIFKKATEDNSWIKHVFKHRTCNSTKKQSFISAGTTQASCYDVWVMRGCYICSRNEDGTFTNTYDYPIVHFDAEWEMAIKEVIDGTETDAFIGGTQHGNEIVDNITFLIDGQVCEDITTIADNTECEKLEIVRTSKVYRNNTLEFSDSSNPTDGIQVATHYVCYTITHNDITINQNLDWIVDTTCNYSCMAMLGARRLLGDGTTQVSDTGMRQDEGIPYDCGTSGFTTPIANSLENCKKAWLWNRGSNGGLKCSFSAEILEETNMPGKNFKFSNHDSYNKFYFGYCTNGQKVSSGDRWHCKAKYTIDYHGIY